jgi:hypothetical protein
MKPITGSGAFLRASSRSVKEPRALLQQIASRGREIPVNDLVAALGLAADDIRPALQDLFSSGYVTLSGPPLNQTLSLTRLGETEIGLQPLPAPSEPPPPGAVSASTTLADEVELRLKKVLAGPSLANFEGAVSVRALREGNALPLADKRLFRTLAGQPFSLAVRFHPSGEATGQAVTGNIRISGGEDTSEVLFQLQLESDTLEFAPRVAALSAKPGAISEQVEFTAKSPLPGGSHSVWLQVYQQNRLVQTVEVCVSAES